MDLNLDALKREILEYLDSKEFAVFRSSPGGLEGIPMVLWDAEKHPDYQMFLEVARKSGIRLIMFASREFEAEDYESRLRELRAYEGVTCSLELAFDHNSRLYVYEVQPDWYEEYLGVEEEIMTRLTDDETDQDDSLGGYFSKN